MFSGCETIKTSSNKNKTGLVHIRFACKLLEMLSINDAVNVLYKHRSVIKPDLFLTVIPVFIDAVIIFIVEVLNGVCQCVQM